MFERSTVSCKKSTCPILTNFYYGIFSFMKFHRIEMNPTILLGKPVIRGTRIPVELILRNLSEGSSEEDILEAYPTLTKEDLHEALAYAADVISHEMILEVASS